MDVQAHLERTVARHPYPLIFATISGAHLYGFPSPNSDCDLRGCHILPAREVVGLDTGSETIEDSRMDDGLELDLVTHDARKFFAMLLKPNGYVLEQLLSPFIVHTTSAHDELKAIAAHCITRHHAHHYLGFSASQWRLVQSEQPPRVKPLLYTYRVLLTGIHLMRTGVIEANLVHLNEDARLSHVNDLIARKTSGEENDTFDAAELLFHDREFVRLTAELEEAQESSTLLESPSARPALNDLLIRLRMATV